MSTQLYANVHVYWEGSLLTEAASVKISRKTNSIAQTTIAKGYAGESPGAPTIEISVESAVPSAGFELNPGEFMKANKTGELTLLCGGKTLTSTGSITDDDLNYAVNQEAKLSFNFRGGWADWT